MSNGCNNTDLRQCPFCGSTKLKIDSKKGTGMKWHENKKYVNHTATIRCNKCHARGPTVSVYLEDDNWNAKTILRDKATDKWNTRV